ncbi:calcium-binding protein [Mycolicibacterium sp. P1-18]|uniref:excalibur calcium-binding domain-containing protein n=1 Tax=Mycolicibacterium sp. P1-18 TaxID=2024615 RepID=UPI0011F158B8|nr:excalibur calcium-binding domain-containing protein [Mycolicibacterium sp. P1-18]KAA0093692.1 calcium-binding protein [Mycolicibacterium sp. P1-18]
MFIRLVIASAAVAAVAVGIAPAASAAGPYKNCTAAHADNRWDIPQGDPDYVSSQDRDGDGIACES